jgi:RNase P subunit RPR2
LTPERQRAPISSCWECEQALDAPRTVTIRVDRRDVSTIILCPTCYWTVYRPLARDESGVLDGSPSQSTSVWHRSR